MSASDPSRDPVDALGDALRRAWSELSAPEPDAPAGDPAEEAAAAWMRAAWSALEPPPAELPFAVRRRARRARLAPLALAAGLTGLAAAAVLAMVVALRERAAEHADALARAGAEAHEETIEVAAVDAGRMELRSGPVRLILLDEWTEAPAPRADAR
jgi:hypothetical protein